MNRCVVAILMVVTWTSMTSGQVTPVSDLFVTSDLNDPVSGTGRYDTLHRMDTSPKYMVLASGTVRPGTVYRVVVVLLDLPGTGLTDLIKYPLHVRASIARDGVEISSAKKNMSKADMQTLLMQVPDSVTGGEYRLRVEGDHYGSTGGGGSVFVNETRLQFSQRFLTVLIQTSRPYYTFSQTVRFRVILLRTDLKPFDDSVNIYVVDPDGYIIRRWLARSSNNGVVSLAFKTSAFGKNGWWTIRVAARGQTEHKKIFFKKYGIPQWEVFVWTPTYFLLSNDAIVADVGAAYTTDKLIRGSVQVELWARQPAQTDDLRLQFKLVSAQRITNFYGSTTASFPMENLRGKFDDLAGAEVKVLARVTDFWFNETYEGWCNSKLISPSVSVKFLGSSPQFFKPMSAKLPSVYFGQVLVSYHDNAPLSPEDLRKSALTIRSSAGGEIRIPSIEEQQSRTRLWPNSSWSDSTQNRVARDSSDSRAWTSTRGAERLMQEYLDSQEWAEYRSSGLYRFRMDMPSRSSSVELTASFQGADSAASSTSLRLEPFHSVSRRFISVETSNQVIDVGEYAIFHIRSNFPLNQLYTVITSKNMVIYGDKVPVEDHNGPVMKTISVAVSPEMTPSFRLVVFHVTDDGEVISDSIHVPVEALRQGQAKLVLNQHKDRTKQTVEITSWSTPGSTFCTNSIRAYLYSVQAGHDLSRYSVLASLHSFENSSVGLHRALWQWRDGSRPIRSKYYPTASYAVDTNSTFQLTGLLALTDAKIDMLPGSECGAGEARCLTRGCYNATKKCDGFDDCSDRSDEANCGFEEEREDAEQVFRLKRRYVYKDFFDPGSGDWAWTLQNIGYLGVEQKVLEVPETTDDWYINGFSISQKHGFSLIEQPLPFSSSRPFYMSLDVASQIKRGETISPRLLLANNEDFEVVALVVLKGSPDYEFIHVGPYGTVSHRNVKTSKGDNQHLVSVPAGARMEVTIPVKPIIQQGSMTLRIECITQLGRDVETATVDILPEGVQIGKHTSILLDLKNRAIDHKFFDVFTSQSPESLFQKARDFVYGSPRGSVLVSGDVVGPIFPSVPMTTVSVFGKWMRSVDGSIFNFAYNCWSLHYLRLTNQLTPPFLRKVLESMAPFFMFTMKRYRSGAFLFYDGGWPSVWTTAWTIRQLHYSQFQDWENYLYVEPRIMSEAAQWITLYQNVDGSFNETEWYQIPLDQKMSAGSRVAGENHRRRHVTLTAHVLISLHQVIDKVQGNAKSMVTSAKRLAMQYLERILPNLSDPYEIAITAYALTVSNSVERGAAFNSLQATVRTELSGMYYWSRERLDTNPLSVGTNQRPYLQAKNEQVWDAQAVEATSYALLVYVLRNGVSVDQERIVTWLNTMRMYNGGWISTVDTIVALEALVEYAYRARLRDVTSMTVEVEASANQMKRIVKVTGNHTSQLEPINLQDVWGHVNIMGRGAGQAVVQMDVTFGVDQEALKDSPPVRAFELRLRENMIQNARNKSIIVVEAWLRWVNTDESAISGAAVLEVETPSGYRIEQYLINSNLHRFRNLPNNTLSNGQWSTDKVIWYFDKVYSNYTQYFNWTIYRRHLVSNYTAFRSARLYEYFAPERFEMQILNSTELNVVDICQVCGSYQCPYCPWYSGTAILTPSTTTLVFVFTVYWFNLV